MDSEKAKFLNDYLLTSISAFNDAIEQSFEDYEINGKLVNFKEQDFDKHYNDFLKELEVVIFETKDIYIVHDYIDSCLNEILSWKGFNNNQNKAIFKNGNDISFLIKLKQNIEKYSTRIKSLYETDSNGEPLGLIDIYNVTIKAKQMQNDGNNQELTSTLMIESAEYKPDFDIRFDFENMQAECDELKNTPDKILFIYDRLYYFKQWILQYDVEEMFIYKFSPKYYPNFEKLCNMELERIMKKLELEKKLILPIPKTDDLEPLSKEDDIKQYNWNATDTDLLELIVSLLKTNTIVRKDGKELTQKELKEVFEKLFGMEIKGAKGKLSNAVIRKKTTAPFLESLKIAFEEYSKSRK